MPSAVAASGVCRPVAEGSLSRLTRMQRGSRVGRVSQYPSRVFFAGAVSEPHCVRQHLHQDFPCLPGKHRNCAQLQLIPAYSSQSGLPLISWTPSVHNQRR